ncbi:respiratory chain complex I subunit 1 family protein [Desulfitobacterium metallireducens]|uniref:Formate hydrogenlyase n=1 Tax=Desulfitobacterium metallireducens DSM 15288 TaxID=871968 RepID=W0EFL1_9FIRM|nr:NADH-quinone oxidoreductase subunit H [Desulfitobacterium metallireducens]AHF07861.1 formate hydrogenlyase [Desulfitobacterium metallireducens DSM 15288]
MLLDFEKDLGTIFFSIGHVLILFALAPLLQGWIKKAKAFWQMRKGPSLWQPYRDLRKYWFKEEVVSEHASWIFLITPSLVLGSSLLATLVLPNPWGWAPMSQYGTIFWLVASFGVARFFLTLAGLDVAGAFGGMGSSRELFVAALVEPGFLLSLSVLALMTGTTSLTGLIQYLQGISLLETPRLLAVLALGFIVIAEMGRIPVDNPDTHLELTMIHEGMLLDYSGRSLAFLNWAEQLKQLILLELLALIIGAQSLVAQILCVALLGALFATIESLNVKMRLFRIPNYLAAATASAMLALVTFLLMEGGI